MKIKHLDHLNLSVSNFEDTAHWYERIFGFKIVEQGTYRNNPWGVIKAGDAMLCIYQDSHRSYIDSDELRGRKLHGINHFGLRITDREQWEATIVRENIEVFYGGAFQWPNSTAWYIKDPTGYDIEVVLWNDEVVTFNA